MGNQNERGRPSHARFHHWFLRARLRRRLEGNKGSILASWQEINPTRTRTTSGRTTCYSKVPYMGLEQRTSTSNSSMMPAAMETERQTSGIVTDAYLQSVLDISTHTRQQCMNLVDLAEANAVVGSGKPSLEVQLELSKQQKLLYSYLAQLRGSNRNAINKVRNTKQTTAEARQEIDRLHLQLQNLYYEERHLRGEITACESYEFVQPLTPLAT